MSASACNFPSLADGANVRDNECGQADIVLSASVPILLCQPIGDIKNFPYVMPGIALKGMS
jgi:hypothetical protein